MVSSGELFLRKRARHNPGYKLSTRVSFEVEIIIKTAKLWFLWSLLRSLNNVCAKSGIWHHSFDQFELWIWHLIWDSKVWVMLRARYFWCYFLWLMFKLFSLVCLWQCSIIYSIIRLIQQQPKRITDRRRHVEYLVYKTRKGKEPGINFQYRKINLNNLCNFSWVELSDVMGHLPI